MNGAWLDPQQHILVVSAHKDHVQIDEDEEGHLTIGILNLDEGIEIVHDDDRLWRPA